MNKYTCNSLKDCVLKVGLEYPKEFRELHNDYHLSPDKIEYKNEMLPKYQLMISDLNKISIGNVKKLVPNVFGKTSVCFIMCETSITTKKYIAY